MKLKRHIGVAAIAVASLLLPACSGGDGGDSGDMTTVVIWDRAGTEANAKKDFFKEWNKNEGRDLGIKVKYEPKATERYEDIVRLGFQTGRGPDIFHSPSSQLGAYVAAGWVQPVGKLVDQKVIDASSRYLSDTSELVWNGKPYALPTTLHVVRLVYNKGLFKKAGLDPADPPSTFSEVEKAAKAITKNTNAYGFGIPMAWVGFQAWTVDLPILCTNENLTQWGLFNIKTGKFETWRYKPSIEHYRTLIGQKLAYPGAATLDTNKMTGAFAEGKLAMYVSSGSVVGTLRQLDSSIDLGVGPIPIPDGEPRVQSPMNAGFPYAISSKVENTEAVGKVYEALVGTQMQKALVEHSVPPISMKVWDSQAAQEKEWLQLFHPTKQDKQWPKKPGSVISVEGQDVTKTNTELILNPSMNVDSTLQQLSQRYQQAWEKAVEQGTVDPKEFGR